MNPCTRLAALALIPMFASCNVLPRDVPPGDTLEDRAAAVETVLARVRDLPFKHPVPVEEQDKASLKAYLDQSMEKTWDTTGALSERAYKVLGLLPRDLEMKSWSSGSMSLLGFADCMSRDGLGSVGAARAGVAGRAASYRSAYFSM